MNFLQKFFGCFFGGFLFWRIRPNTEQELQTANVIIGMAHGLRENGHSPSNEAIATIALELARRYKLPLVLQYQVADCVPDTSLNITSVGKGAGYLNTHDVLVRTRAICESKGLHRAIIVTHRIPYWRVLRCAEKHGFEILAVDVSSVPHDSQSKQLRTRSSWLLMPYDIAARLWFLVHGWI